MAFTGNMWTGGAGGSTGPYALPAVQGTGTVNPMTATLPSTSTTTRQFDPGIAAFINNLLGRVGGSTDYNVPEYTKSALESFVRTPRAPREMVDPSGAWDLAGQQFSKISAPLLREQAEGQKLQNQATMDMFRKAGMGTMQSGAFAQAARQQAADQGRAQERIIAGNYIPLMGEATKTAGLTNEAIASMNQAERAIDQSRLAGITTGLGLPGAEMAGQQNLTQILSTLYQSPTKITTQGAQAQLVPGGIATAR